VRTAVAPPVRAPRTARLVVALLVVGALAGALGLRADGAQSYDVTVLRDLRYASGPGSSADRNVLDAYFPEGLAQYPFVMFLHGGGWVAGDKDLGPGLPYDNVGRALASRGVAVVLANYRLSDGSDNSVTHPGHVEDVARALVFTRALLNSRGVDPSDMYVGGHDAGAHLAALLATNDRFLAAEDLAVSDVRGVIGVSGIYRIDSSSSDLSDVFGTDPSSRLDASPIDHVHGGEPPFLLLRASDDLEGRDEEAEALAGALRAAGDEVSSREIADRDHDSIVAAIGQPGDVTTALILHFVDSHLERTPTPTTTAPPTATPTVVPTATSGPAAQPTQPPDGPGGVLRPHGQAVHHVFDRDGARFALYEPSDPLPASAPLVVFAGRDDTLEDSPYAAFLDHVARGGAIVVHLTYGAQSAPSAGEMCDAAEAAYWAAVEELTGSDVQRAQPRSDELVWVGHGRGAMVAGRLAAEWFGRRLPPPRALMMLMPRRLPGAVDTERTLPRDTMALLVLAEEDQGRDEDLERDIWRGLAEIPGAWRQSLILGSDRHGTPALVADFDSPLAALDHANGPAADALDWFGPWKWLDALVSCSLWRVDCEHALGDTDEQRYMGHWSDGAPVREPEVEFGPRLAPRRTGWLPVVFTD